MALADKIDQYRVTRWEKCPVVLVVDKLSKEDQVAFNKALDNGISTNTIVMALRSDGHKLGHETLNKHRNGLCRCATK